MASKQSPWLFIPTLYFQQGLPVILVQQFSVLLYKKLGVPNERIGLWTSLLAWPWIIKMLWGPLVDLTASKRSWTLAMQVAISAGLLAVALAVTSTYFFPLTLALLAALAFLSATHDIALDGYYLVSLPQESQAFFLGISNASFRLAWIFCTGTLVILAGLWERSGVAVANAWMRTIIVGALIYGALAVYASWAMPRSPLDRPARARAAGDSPGYADAFRTFFSQPGSVSIVLFILLYRFGESMLSKMTGLFMLDPRSAGGLGFDTVQVGAVLGSCGVISLILGGVLGGIAVSRIGVRRCLWPMALFMHVPNLMYVWAAAHQPGVSIMYVIAAVDQFAYGFGLSAYMVYIMTICQNSQYQASHYAIATGLMALGAMGAGIASGYLQSHFGYFWFFVWVCFLTLPGLVLLTQLPLEPLEAKAKVAA